MPSQERTSVVSEIVKVAFPAKPSMTEDHWKEIGGPPSESERETMERGLARTFR